MNRIGLGIGLMPLKDDTIKNEQKQKKQEELRFIRSELKVPGHTTFSYNLVTGEIKVAEFKYCDTCYLDGTPLYRPKIIMEKDCVYRQALNRANLIKRLKREGIFRIV